MTQTPLDWCEQVMSMHAKKKVIQREAGRVRVYTPVSVSIMQLSCFATKIYSHGLQQSESISFYITWFTVEKKYLRSTAKVKVLL